MSSNNPPRFVPTLTETLINRDLASTVSDDSMYVRSDPGDSMLDLDLSDESPVKLQHVSPLTQYQDINGYQTLASAMHPVALEPVTPQDDALPLASLPRVAGAQPVPAAAVMPAASPVVSPADVPAQIRADHVAASHAAATAAPVANTAQPAAPAAGAASSQGTRKHALGLPDSWQQQMQEAIQRAVRQELQQQLPFLLLQWSRQIEEKVTPQVQIHIIKLMQSWYKQQQ